MGRDSFWRFHERAATLPDLTGTYKSVAAARFV
jgi:hypothetical protein